MLTSCARAANRRGRRCDLVRGLAQLAYAAMDAFERGFVDAGDSVHAVRNGRWPETLSTTRHKGVPFTGSEV